MNKRIKKKRNKMIINDLKKIMWELVRKNHYSFKEANSTEIYETINCLNEFYNPLGFKAVATNLINSNGLLEIVLVEI